MWHRGRLHTHTWGTEVSFRSRGTVPLLFSGTAELVPLSAFLSPVEPGGATSSNKAGEGQVLAGGGVLGK